MLSIIVPFCNSEAYLPSIISSILSQTFADYEVLLIDDGSSDASFEVASSFSKKDNRIKVFRQSNEGASSARNRGIENASGDLICFFDADDILMPNALSIMVSGMEEASTDLFIGGYIVKDDDGNVVYSVPEAYTEILTREQGIEQMYIPRPYRYQGYIWNKMFRRSVIEKNRIRFNESISFNEDRLFVTQYIAAQTGGILFDSTPVYSYFEHKDGAMASLHKGFNSKFVTDFEAMIKMLKVIRHTFHDKKLTTMAQDGVMDSYARIHYMMDTAGGVQKGTHKKMKIKLLSSSPIFIFYLLRTHFGGSPFSSTH